MYVYYYSRFSFGSQEVRDDMTLNVEYTDCILFFINFLVLLKVRVRGYTLYYASLPPRDGFTCPRHEYTAHAKYTPMPRNIHPREYITARTIYIRARYIYHASTSRDI